jgi:predicted metal-binding membrane protein
LRGKEGWGQGPFLPLVGTLALGAWAALWLLGSGPYARYLDHGGWLGAGSALAACRAIPGGDALVSAAIYSGGWLLMTMAMMLPTTLPLLQGFERVVGARSDRGRLLTLVIAGYLLVWTGFGIAAHLLDTGLHTLARQSTWLVLHGWTIGAAIFALAGLFQFSRLKYNCLARCRTPLSFILKHWHGPRPLRNALALGLDHGLYCVGCCWAIMLLMFVVGSGSLGWMLALAAVMAGEKNLPRGTRLAHPLGGALLAGATAIAAVSLLG